MPTISVDVDFEDFDDDDLIEELEGRGYTVFDSDASDTIRSSFSNEELDLLQSIIDESQPVVGSVLYNIREKLVNWP